MGKDRRIEVDVERTFADLSSLVRIDSQNPGPCESAIGAWVLERLRAAGHAPTVQQVEPDRHNLIVNVPGHETAPRLVLLAHLDTVPVGEGWSVPPLEGIVRDGRLYGRGAADMKSGLALAINLLDALARRGPAQCEVVVGITVDEEAPRMAGAHALVDGGWVRKNDQVLALEPTGMRLRIAQVGLRWLELTIFGRMAHAGRAQLGLDANHAMARFIDRLKTRVAALPYQDPLLGHPLFTCGKVAGGVATNVVPPSCRAELDVRIVPPMTTESAMELAEQVARETIAEFPGARYELAPLGAARPSVRASEASKIVMGLRKAFTSATGRSLESGGADGHEAYTDASMIAALLGSDSCTVFGPGSTDRAHQADEYVELADVVACAHVLENLIEQW